MLDLLSASVEYGGYISIIKLIGFIILFFGWLPLVGWVHHDAKIVETNHFSWTCIILGTGAAGAIIWLLIPIYIVGMMFFLIAVGATSLAYVKHRNVRVLDFDKVLGLKLGETEKWQTPSQAEPKIKKLIEKREDFRKQKKWEEADKIRANLKKQGIVLEDTEKGVRWKRV